VSSIIGTVQPCEKSDKGREVDNRTDEGERAVGPGWDKRTDGNERYKVSTVISHFPSKFALDILGNLQVNNESS
jgi:hypothetical protein